MLDVSFWELGIILIVALLVIGPDQLPAVARRIAKGMAKLKRWRDHVKTEMSKVADEVSQDIAPDVTPDKKAE